MAHLVKIEPGDILVLSNLAAPYESEEAIRDFTERIEWLKECLNLSHILVFEGDVDLSVLPAGWTPDAVAGT